MNYRNILIICLMVVGVAYADPQKSITVDFASPGQASDLELYQGNIKALTVTLRNNGTALNASAYSPAFYFFTGSQCTTCAVSWVNSTNGVFSVALTSNNLAASGIYTYGAAVSNSVGITIAQRGILRITPDPNR